MTDQFNADADQLAGLLHEMRAQWPQIKVAAQRITAAIRAGGKLLICGNGGSCAQALHMAAEFTGHFELDRPPLPAIAICADQAALTAIANDFGSAEIFERQVLALGKPGDVLLAISTSGNSDNVIDAVDVALGRAMMTIGLLGKDGGAVGHMAHHSIIVPSNSVARIQEVHAFVCHLICSSVERALYPATD